MRTSLKAVRVFMGAISSQRWPAQASARIRAMSSSLSSSFTISRKFRLVREFFVRRREADDKERE
jgi:hypothetical protein